MVSAALIAIAGILVFAGLKTTFYIIKILAGLAWIGLFAWWQISPFTTAGSPAHVIVLMVVLFAGIACFFWPMWETKFKNGQERGGRFRLPGMQSDEQEEEERQRRNISTWHEGADAYTAKLNAALRGERRRR